VRPLLLLLLLAAPATASPASLDAPLGVRTPGTLRELFLDVTLSDARAPRRITSDLRWSAANTWSTPTVVTRGGRSARIWTDEQADSLTFAPRVPWTIGGLRGASALELRVTAHWGGWSDPIISGWHRVLGVHNYTRGRYPESVARLALAGDGDRAAFSFEGARIAAGDVVLRNQLTVLSGGAAGDPLAAWAVAVRADLKIPTGALASAGGSRGFDAGAALVATRALTPWSTLHAMASVKALSRLPSYAGLQPERLQLGGEISLALHGGRWALLIEDRVHSPLMEGGWSYAGSASARRSTAFPALFWIQNQVSVGVRRGALTLWVSEDVTPGGGDPAQRGYYLSNAPDIVLGLAFAWDG
jgi:hypothetical protein